MITISTKNASANSMRNLVNMVFTREKLLSKATGGTFHVSEELVQAIKQNYSSREMFIQEVNTFLDTNPGALEGLSFTYS